LVHGFPFSMILMLLLLCLPLTSAHGAPDSCYTKTTDDQMFAPDKARHLIGSFMLTVLSAKIAEHHLNLSERGRRQIAVVIPISIGLGKELRDQTKSNNRFSWKDMAANITGVCIGLLVLGVD
jgi:uncharacterized protein YfiM (DUF2279 family)